MMNRQQRRAQQKQDKKKKKVESNVRKVISKEDEQRIIEETLKQYEEKYAEAKMKGIQYATNAMFAVMAIALHDKWDWDSQKIKQLFVQMDKTFSAVQEDYVKIEELIELVYDELGIELK